MVVGKVQSFCYDRKEKKKVNRVDGSDYVDEKEKNNDDDDIAMITMNEKAMEESNYNDMKINPLHEKKK